MPWPLILTQYFTANFHSIFFQFLEVIGEKYPRFLRGGLQPLDYCDLQRQSFKVFQSMDFKSIHLQVSVQRRTKKDKRKLINLSLSYIYVKQFVCFYVRS